MTQLKSGILRRHSSNAHTSRIVRHPRQSIAYVTAAPSRCASRHRRCSGRALSAAAKGNADSDEALSVVVIGGGAGGLATAGRLANAGAFNVTVLEQNPEVGGRLQSVMMGGCRFDTGPSLLLFKDKYEEAFESMGTTMEDHVSVQRVEPAAYRVFFGDGTSLDLLYDVQAMVKQLEGIEAGAGVQYLRFLSESRTALELGTENFIERDFNGLGDFLDLTKIIPLLRYTSIPELLGQHDDRMSKRFKDKRIRAMFTFQDLYVGLSPYNAPGVYSLLAATELTDGVWYPIGGMIKVRDGLTKAAQDNGVEIRCNAKVESITTDPTKGCVTGVVLADGETLEADIVVCNPDIAMAYGLLDQPYGKKRSEELSSLEYSAGIIAYNWAVTRKVDSEGRCSLDKLVHHNIILSGEFEKSWDRAKDATDLLKRPNFYVHVPSRTDPSAAPEGLDSIMVLLPVANMQERGGNSDYEDLIAEGREAVFSALEESGAGDLRDCIASELVIPPPEWKQRYSLQHGAAFGLSHGLDQLAVFRPAVHDSKVGGLYFCGASTRPGNGIPLVLIGSRITAERIMKDTAGGQL